MTKTKMRFMLEMSVDLLQMIHASICRSKINRDKKIEIAEDIQKIQSKMFLLDRKLKGVKMNAR